MQFVLKILAAGWNQQVAAIARTFKERNTMGEIDVVAVGRWLLSRGDG